MESNAGQFNQNYQGALAFSLEGSPHAHMLFDDSCRVIDCNAQAVAFFAYESRDALLSNWHKEPIQAVPIRRKSGRSPESITEGMKWALEEGFFDFEVEFFLGGKIRRMNVALKRLAHAGAFFLSACLVDLTSMRVEQDELILQGNLMNAINQVASTLMMASTEDFDNAIWKALQTIGRVMGIDRVYIWQNFEEGGARFCRQTYEWSEGAEPQQGKDFAEALPYDEVPYWRDCVFTGRPLNSPVKYLPYTERAVLEPQDILSILVIPVMLEGEAWGFIGYDDCCEERYFSNIEEQVLLSGGNLIVSAIIRNQTMGDLKEQIIAAQRASRANESKSNFLARTSHEIRTPMNAIIGMAELALRENISPIVRSHVNDIKHAGTSLLAIINDILDFSKIESGKFEIVPVNYQISSLLGDVISIIRMKAAQKCLMFTVDVDAALPNNLYGDSIRIRQVLINILDNAVKYTKEGFVTFRVKMKADERPDWVRVAISVEDTGGGIKPEDFDKLFLDFVQIDSQKNWGVVGTGLGLTIARSFLHAMGGEISVESEYGRGSAFRIEIPQQVRSGERLAEVERASDIRVLMYDDCARCLESIEYACETLGVAFDGAATRDELQKMLRAGTYSHLFVGARFFEEAAILCKEEDCACEMVLLAEVEAARPAGVRLIPTPVYAVGVANLLNDVLEHTLYNEEPVTFTAPDACILIVDDNSTNLRVAVGLLKPYEMRVDTCLSGVQALELVERERYDMIFMDHMMPEMDGIEVTERIRAMGGGDDYCASVPIVALTANAVSGMREMFLEHGMNAFLSKPIDVSKLHAELERWLPDEKILRGGVSQMAPREVFEEIEGIDTALGMRLTGGTAQKYAEVLTFYCSEGAKLIRTIESCLAENDLARFTIYVHALKSSSAAIGATDLSERAGRLEEAGSSMDRRFIISNADDFLRDLAASIRRIRLVLDERTVDVPETTDRQMLVPQLQALLEAISAFDLNRADSILADLKSIRSLGEAEERIEEIAEDIMLSDFDVACARIEVLIAAETAE